MVSFRTNVNKLEGIELCQEQKDKPEEQRVKRDGLRAVLNAKRAARDEDLRVQYVVPGGGPQGRNAAQHAKLPAVFVAQVAESAG